MDHRDVVVALTNLTPDSQREAVEALQQASPQELDDFAMFVARLMSLDTGRTIGVWAVGALVARWREAVELSVARGEDPATLAWPAIRAIRRRCLPVLHELRTVWFGWSEWDDCLIIAPLAAIEHDKWYDVGLDIVFAMVSRSTPASNEAARMLSTWFAERTEQAVEAR